MIDQKFDEIVEFAEVEKFIDTPVKRYSSGMYLRLAFAVAAHLEPEILLVDEVLAVGDVSFQRKCLGKMGEVAREGRTVLFVSHNMSAITSLTNRCIALSGGRLVEEGETGEVIRNYLAQAVMNSARISWEAGERPGDEDTFEFLSCQVGDGTTTELNSYEPVELALEFRVKRPVEGLRVGFDLINHEGVHVFRTYHDDEVKEPGILEPGVYTTRCALPGNMMNQGEYYVTLRAGIQAVRRICVLEQAMRFSIVNLVGSNAQYGGYRPGVLNPSLNWRTYGAEAELARR